MIILGLGSNLSSSFGNRFENIDHAISLIESSGIKIIKRSSFYETPSYPSKSDPKFINVVIEISTELPPKHIASILISIEEKLERKRNKKNDPRTCDIDIIDYKGQTFEFKFNKFNFVVPHKGLIYRNFVLYPLKEILPNWKHPKTDEIVSNLINKLPNEEKKSILKINKN